MTTYVLELRSTADYKDCRYREYTTSKRKADLFARVPRIPFTDSGHGIVPYVREHSGRREPRNMVLQDHVVDSIKAMTQPTLQTKRLCARQQASVDPSHEMLVAGARSIANTAHTDNHIERARACWTAMQRAKEGVEEPKP